MNCLIHAVIEGNTYSAVIVNCLFATFVLSLTLYVHNDFQLCGQYHVKANNHLPSFLFYAVNHFRSFKCFIDFYEALIWHVLVWYYYNHIMLSGIDNHLCFIDFFDDM